MIELREVTAVLYYFRSCLVLLAVFSFILARQRRSSSIWKQALGIEVSVFACSLLNIILLVQPLRLRVIWDVLIGVLASALYFQIRRLREKKTAASASHFVFIKSVSFWILTILYIVFFPSVFAPIR